MGKARLSEPAYSRDCDGNIFTNHMGNWPLWVKEHPDDLGAQMLGSALEEIERLQKYAVKWQTFAAALQEAYVLTCERLIGPFRAFIVEISDPTKIDGIGDAWKYIQTLNEWRRLGKFRGLEP